MEVEQKVNLAVEKELNSHRSRERNTGSNKAECSGNKQDDIKKSSRRSDSSSSSDSYRSAHSSKNSIDDSENKKIPPVSSYRQREVSPNKCLAIFGLSIVTTSATIRNKFSKFGCLKDVCIVTDKLTGLSRGISYVYFDSLSDAKVAKREMQGQIIDDKKIRLDYSLSGNPYTPCYNRRSDRNYYRGQYLPSQKYHHGSSVNSSSSRLKERSRSRTRSKTKSLSRSRSRSQERNKGRDVKSSNENETCTINE